MNGMNPIRDTANSQKGVFTQEPILTLPIIHLYIMILNYTYNDI